MNGVEAGRESLAVEEEGRVQIAILAGRDVQIEVVDVEVVAGGRIVHLEDDVAVHDLRVCIANVGVRVDEVLDGVALLWDG